MWVPIKEGMDFSFVRRGSVLQLRYEEEWYGWVWALGRICVGWLAAWSVAEGWWKHRVMVTEYRGPREASLRFNISENEVWSIWGKKRLEEGRDYLMRLQNCVNMSSWGGWFTFILSIFMYHCYCFLLKFTHYGIFTAAVCCTNLHQNWKELWHHSLKTQLLLNTENIFYVLTEDDLWSGNK